MPPKKKNEDAFSDNVQTVKSWLEANGKGTDVVNKTFSTDGKKHSMLYRACRLGRFEIAKMLVDDFNANVDIKNTGDDKSVPLHGACYGGCPPCVALLVHNGADVGMQNAHGESPLDNAKSPADGVKKAFSAKCQKLLGSLSASADQLKVATQNLSKIASISEPTSIAGKTTAPTSEAIDEGKPPTKATKKETPPSVAATPAATTTGPHPIYGKTLLFTGTFKVKKNVHEARVVELGGKTTANEKKMDWMVKGKVTHLSDKEDAAYRKNLPVWTEEEFVAVCKNGWSAVPPPPSMPPVLQCLLDTNKMTESYRQELLSYLTYQFRVFPFNNDYFLLFTIQNQYSPDAVTIGGCGDVVAPIITAWPGSKVYLRTHKLTDADLQHIMRAIAARGKDASPPIHLDIGHEIMSDNTAAIIADAMPTASLAGLAVHHNTKMTVAGFESLLKAAEKTPTMESVVLGTSTEKHASMEKAGVEWKKQSGKSCKCIVSVYSC